MSQIDDIARMAMQNGVDYCYDETLDGDWAYAMAVNNDTTGVMHRSKGMPHATKAGASTEIRLGVWIPGPFRQVINDTARPIILIRAGDEGLGL